MNLLTITLCLKCFCVRLICSEYADLALRPPDCVYHRHPMHFWSLNCYQGIHMPKIL